MKAAKKTLKEGSNIRDCLGYAPIIEEKQYICNSYLAVELNEHLPLPSELPSNITYPDIKKFIQYPENAEIIELPDATKLKAYIKVQKAFDKHSLPYYDFGEGKPLVNAEYLLQVMEMLPSATAYAGNNPLHQIYFESKNGRAVLLPIRPKDGTTRAKTEI